jgi:hypothetical protein
LTLPMVRKVLFSDGGAIYYVDGEREDSLYNDASLLRLILGNRLEETWIISESQLSSNEVELLWSVESQETTEELDDYLFMHPELVAS